MPAATFSKGVKLVLDVALTTIEKFKGVDKKGPAAAAAANVSRTRKVPVTATDVCFACEKKFSNHFAKDPNGRYIKKAAQRKRVDDEEEEELDPKNSTRDAHMCVGLLQMTEWQHECAWCEVCGKWAHHSCINAKETPTSYICAKCVKSNTKRAFFPFF